MYSLCIRYRGVIGRVPAFRPGGPGSIPGEIRNFNSYPGIGCVCHLSVFCPVLSPVEALALFRPHIHGGRPLCICLMFRSIDNCSPYRHLTHGYLSCKSRGGVSPRFGRVNEEKERKKERKHSLFITRSSK